MVLGDGDYTLISRVGDVAVWCVGGRYDALTDTFHPLAMGIRRSLYVGRGAEIVADVALDIPLRERADLKIIGAPRGNPGPDQNFAMVYVDLGYEGVIDAFEPVSADDELLTLAHLPALAGALEGAEFWVWGGAETAGRRTPYSVSFGPTIPETGLLAELGPLLPVPAPVNPVRMGRVESGYIEWSTARPTPDLWRVRISSWNSILRWEVFVPGEQPFVHLPEFPGMDEVLDPRAVPSPRGDAWVSVTAFDIQDFQYDAMEYRDLNRPRPRAVSSAYWPVVFP